MLGLAFLFRSGVRKQKVWFYQFIFCGIRRRWLKTPSFLGQSFLSPPQVIQGFSRDPSDRTSGPVGPAWFAPSSSSAVRTLGNGTRGTSKSEWKKTLQPPARGKWFLFFKSSVYLGSELQVWWLWALSIAMRKMYSFCTRHVSPLCQDTTRPETWGRGRVLFWSETVWSQLRVPLQGLGLLIRSLCTSHNCLEIDRNPSLPGPTSL